jgi:hypothetical protein
MVYFEKFKAGLLLFIILPLCGLAETEKNFDRTKIAVTEMLQRAMSVNYCNSLRDSLSKSKSDETQKFITASCDSDFDFSKPLVFSEMVRKKKSDGPYVCGIVSGTTSYGRKIGARFIVEDTYNLVLNVKLSRKPIVYASSDRYLKETYADELAGFNNLYAKTCL